MPFPNLVLIFILAILVAYYIDFKKDKKNYGRKSRGTLYIIAIILVIISLFYFIFK